MMRPKPSLVALTLVAVALVGCASPWKAAQNKFDREWYWMPIAQYNAMVHERDGFNSATPAAAAMAAGANDVTGERTARCASVFSLFASYIRPGCNSGDMGKFLGDAHWLQQTDVVAAGTSGGQIVLFGDIDAARFRLSLFRDDVGWSNWVIYVSVSYPTGYPPTEDEAWKFLRGACTNTQMRLREFALCYPDGKVRRFTKDKVGLQCYGDFR